VEIVIKQVQPQDIRGLHELRYRNQIRRHGFNVLPARFLSKRLHVAGWIILEMGNLRRHETVNPAVWTHGIGEETGPVTAAWIDVDDGGACIYACEPDQLGSLG
jgi:hypothetical protein